MPAPRDGDALCPTGAVILDGRRGVLRRKGPRSRWQPGTCTWCAADVPKGRKMWCSQRCVDRFNLTQPHGQLAALDARDHGRCRLCGLDTERLRAAVQRWLARHGNRARHPETRRRLADLLTLRGLATSERSLAHLLDERRCWWDGDHTIPIVDGGHPCDMRNLRTLCWWCHRRETSEAATRRAERRRGVVEPTAQVPLFAGEPPPC